MVTTTRGILVGCLLFVAGVLSASAQVGVALGATRVIYLVGQKQAQLAVTNNDDNSTWLIQSWVENVDGRRDGWFVITPPLFAMQGKKENTLRIVDATNDQLPQDRESPFWMNVKAILPADKSKLSDNTLQLVIISRIKLYYRPGKLALPPDQAAEKLIFSHSGSLLTLTSPTPYYLMVTELNARARILENTLVPPMGKTNVKLPTDAGSTITHRTINDYDALMPKTNGVLRQPRVSCRVGRAMHDQKH